MKAVTWQGKRDVRIETVPDPQIHEPTDAVGMEAHGSPVAKAAQQITGLLPDAIGKPLLTDDDPLGVDSFATHTLPLDQAPHAYEIFQTKQDGAVKIVLQP
ncbi:hypothetical protein H7J73_02615 [Mycolicibacterium komossense]|uniref:Uncharacterized protein n=1 Tax=Mycolicibacterium komossense TaxID=1779 RepID=A0ABT3C642_9MYCO|nr:hypothetical protein [Mycolicibacterium komossense]